MKINALVCAVVFSLSLAACSGGSTDNSVPSAAVSPRDAGSSAMPGESEDTPPDEEPLPEEETAAPGDDQSDLLPWDGGTYQYDNGVTVTTKVDLVEPWAEKRSEFCDGCIVLTARDTRFLLRYTIKVPNGLDEPVDASTCSGSLSVDSGNDDEAFTGLAGEYAKDLNGSVRPGATKYGVLEFGVKKEHREDTFTYTNSCGSPSGEEGPNGIGQWGGRLPPYTTPQPESMFKTVKGKYFEVKVVVVRQYDDGYGALAQACVRREVPEFGSNVPSTLSPWSVTVGEQQIAGDPDDQRTTYDNDALLDPEVLPCNDGLIFFPTKGKVTSINYQNSLGERAAWETA